MVVEQGEFIELLSMELEREYKGRVLLLPAFTYLVESQKKRKRSFARMDKSFEKARF